MHYRELLTELEAYIDVEYRAFHKRLLKNDKVNMLGVRIPILRKIAKSYKGVIDELFTYPDEYYEVTFIKLTAAGMLPYDRFIKYVDRCVPLIDNWATCDCFDARCIARNKENFLPYIERYISDKREFYQRYALVTLLRYYVEQQYLPLIFRLSDCADKQMYYVHMAVAWLLAEVLVKHYDDGVSYLLKNSLDKRTHNKAIQKACESFRLSDERKIYLKGIKR